MLSHFILKIKRKETPFYSLLYRIGKGITQLGVPNFFLPFYRLLYAERQGRIAMFRRIITVLYYAPLFRARCQSVGKGFNYVKLQQGFPVIAGNLKITLGDNVIVHSRSTFSAAKVYDSPEFIVGNNTFLGPGLSVSSGQRVLIGDYCLIASNVTINDNDGHPLEPKARIAHQPVAKGEIKPVKIGNGVWIGAGATILKGVTIGDYAVVGANSIVTKDVLTCTVVAGTPARLIKTLDVDEME